MNSAKTISEFISKFHFPIVGFREDSQKEVVIGTCTLIDIDGRCFLLTAAHVMDERHNVKNHELWIWNFSDGSKVCITEDIVGCPGRNIPHWCDVAVVEVNPAKYSSIFKECFLPIEYMAQELDCASWITPVPGGVGQLTVIALLINTLKAFKKEVF